MEGFISTQDHLANSSYNIRHLVEEDNRTHAAATPSGIPDVYVNGEDVTVTVDPVGNSAWIRDDGQRHAHTVARGALKDHRGVIVAQGIIDKHAQPPTNFVPTSDHLAQSMKLSARLVANSTRGEAAGLGYVGQDFTDAHPGTLPVISKMNFDGVIADKPDWVCETEMWRSRDRRNRAFDCGGVCR